jgi:hypothetical protein
MASKPTACEYHPKLKNVIKEKFQVRILQKEVLKLLDFRSLVTIPTRLVASKNSSSPF